MWLVPLGYHEFQRDQARAGLARSGHVGKQPRGRRVVPVMQDRRHHINVGRGDSVEEVTGDNVDPVRQAAVGEQLRGSRDDMGQIEHNPAARRLTR